MQNEQNTNGVNTVVTVNGQKADGNGNVNTILSIVSYANDAAAAAAGIPIGGVYNTAGAVKVRLA